MWVTVSATMRPNVLVLTEPPRTRCDWLRSSSTKPVSVMVAEMILRPTNPDYSSETLCPDKIAGLRLQQPPWVASEAPVRRPWTGFRFSVKALMPST